MLIHANIQAFRDGLIEYIHSHETVTITHNGRVVGYFIPSPRPTEVELNTLHHSKERLNQQLAELHIDEEEIAAEFDRLRKQPSRTPKIPA